MTPYQYVILRYVPNLAAEEFINVGVVLWVPTEKIFKFKINSKFGRISDCFRDFDGDHYRNFVHHLTEYITGKTGQFTDQGMLAESLQIGDICAAIISSEFSSFKWSTARYGLCRDVEERFRTLYYEYVLKNTEHSRRRSKRTKNDVWAKMQTELQKRSLQQHIVQNEMVRATNLELPFQMAWRNGVLQVAEPISFDLTPDKVREKATEWLGKLTVLNQDVDFKFTAVVAEPGIPEAREAYKDALQIMKLNEKVVRAIIPENEFGDFLDTVGEEIKGNH